MDVTGLTGIPGAIHLLLKLVREDRRNFEQVFRDTLTKVLKKHGQKNKRLANSLASMLLTDPDIQNWLNSPQLPQDLQIVEKLAGKLNVASTLVQDFFLELEIAIAKNSTLNTILQNRRLASQTRSLQELLREHSGRHTALQIEEQRAAVQRFREMVQRDFSKIMLFGKREPGEDRVFARMAEMKYGFLPLHLKRWQDEGQQQEAQPLDLEEVFFSSDSPRLLLIRGVPGSGKTTLLRYLAWRFSRDSAKPASIPVYVGLKELIIGEKEEKRALEEYVQEEIRALCPDYDSQEVVLDKKIFLESSPESRMILLLDGIDEIEDPDSHARFHRAVHKLAKNYPRCRIIVTSRPIGLKREDYPKFTAFDLDLLTREQIDAYLQKWFAGDSEKITALQNTLDKRPRMMALARTPFLLSMICFTYAEGGDTALVERRSTLYHECTRYLLGRLYDPDSAKPAELSENQTWDLLKELALRYFLWQEADFPAAEVNVLARRVVSRKSLRVPEKWLDRVEKETGLIQRGQEGFTFVHRTLWEYFTARALLDDPAKGIDFVVRHAANPAWEEVVRLYAGLLPDNEKVEELMRGLWHINRPLALRVTTEIKHPAAPLLKPLIEREGNQGKLLLIDSLAQSLPLIADDRERRTLVDETLRILLLECEEKDCQVIYHAQELLERLDMKPLDRGGLIYELLDLAHAAERQQALLADPANHFEWIEVEGGEFLMGDNDHEPDERPVRRVRVNSFRMMKHPVTNRMQRDFPFGEKFNVGGDDCPAVGNTWWEAYYFALWIGCRLPTEAEWEYAARGGKKRLKDGMQYYFNGGEAELPNHAWFGEPPGRPAHPVNEPNPRTGRENLNPLGLANMLGNVWEWCADWYGKYEAGESPEEAIETFMESLGLSKKVPLDNPDEVIENLMKALESPEKATSESLGQLIETVIKAFDLPGKVQSQLPDQVIENPRGPASGTLRVLRGGAYYLPAYVLRCAYRYRDNPTLRDNVVGFRCVQDV